MAPRGEGGTEMQMVKSCPQILPLALFGNFIVQCLQLLYRLLPLSHLRR